MKDAECYSLMLVTTAELARYVYIAYQDSGVLFQTWIKTENNRSCTFVVKVSFIFLWNVLKISIGYKRNNFLKI